MIVTIVYIFLPKKSGIQSESELKLEALAGVNQGEKIMMYLQMTTVLIGK